MPKENKKTEGVLIGMEVAKAQLNFLVEKAIEEEQKKSEEKAKISNVEYCVAETKEVSIVFTDGKNAAEKSSEMVGFALCGFLQTNNPALNLRRGQGPGEKSHTLNIGQEDFAYLYKKIIEIIGEKVKVENNIDEPTIIWDSMFSANGKQVLESSSSSVVIEKAVVIEKKDNLANDPGLPASPPPTELESPGEGDNTQEEGDQVRRVSCNVEPSNRAKDVCKFFHSHLPSVKQLGLGGLVFQGAATFALGSSIVLGFVTLKAIGLAVLGAGIAASLGTGIGFMILGMAAAGIGVHYLTKNKNQPIVTVQAYFPAPGFGR